MGFRILVVEDEMTIALLIEDMLGELGHEVVAMAMRLPQAMEMAQRTNIDLAILDVNLDGRMSFAVADLLETGQYPSSLPPATVRASRILIIIDRLLRSRLKSTN